MSESPSRLMAGFLLEVKSMAGYRVRKRDDKYEVLYPSGKVRCCVDDGELAYEIATELMRERSQEPTPVRCVESGEIFKDHYEAAKEYGGNPNGIKRCCLGIISRSCGLRWEFADALEA